MSAMNLLCSKIDLGWGHYQDTTTSRAINQLLYSQIVVMSGYEITVCLGIGVIYGKVDLPGFKMRRRGLCCGFKFSYKSAPKVDASGADVVFDEQVAFPLYAIVGTCSTKIDVVKEKRLRNISKKWVGLTAGLAYPWECANPLLPGNENKK